jgi:MarR family transcriptional repressor of emrRAB
MSRLRTANLLGALAGEVTNRLDRRLKSHPNQTNSSAAALNFIADYEGCTNATLAKALQLSHPATVRLVDKLEAEGLVESRDATDDGRAVSLHLTEAGATRAEVGLQDRCATLSDFLEVLSAEEQAQFAHCMEKILERMTNSVAQAAYICRLCDAVACPPEHCPVHQAAMRDDGSVPSC